MTTGARIKQARKARGLTQKQLGAISGTSEITIRQYELGKRQPRLEQLQRIATALGVHILDLVGIGEELDKYVVEIDGITQEQFEELNKKFPDCRAMYDALSEQEKTRFWNEIADPFKAELDEIFRALNDAGRQKVVDYARDILPTHRRQEYPQNAATEPPHNSTDETT